MPFLPELSWDEAREALKRLRVAILPVGSVEQHGPQNPLGTDYLVAWELAKRAAEAMCELLLLPIPYGVSEHHSHFPGTLWVSEEALEEYVYGVIRSLAEWGLRRVVIVNGHGGNLQALLRVSRRARKEKLALVVVYQWWTAVASKFREVFGEEGLGHAAALETSLIAYLYPEYVKLDKAVDEEVKRMFKVPAAAYWYTKDFTSSGVFGVASTASREKGKEIFEASVEMLVELIKELKAVDLSRVL